MSSLINGKILFERVGFFIFLENPFQAIGELRLLIENLINSSKVKVGG